MEKQTSARLLILEEQVARLTDELLRLKTVDNTAAIESVIRAWIPQVSDTIVQGLMPVFIQKIQELERRVEELESRLQIHDDIEFKLDADRAAAHSSRLVVS